MLRVHSPFSTTDDQWRAIGEISENILNGQKFQTLLGVTGSGKTFVMSKIAEYTGLPCIVLSPNKTLVAQQYEEFKQFFPENHVEYYVSYFDYYQPEVYMPTTDTYIEKDSAVNEQLQRLRLNSITKIASQKKDLVVASSVSCIFGAGNPYEFYQKSIHLRQGQGISRNKLLRSLNTAMYERDDSESNLTSHSTYRVKGDTILINTSHETISYRITLWGDEIETIEQINKTDKTTIDKVTECTIFPGHFFMTTDAMEGIMEDIRTDLDKQVNYFLRNNRPLEAKRIEERTLFDLEMISELGTCNGIENYAYYFDKLPADQKPFCLLDYFPSYYIMFVDESHVTIPQVQGMKAASNRMKDNLIEYGFRLPTCKLSGPLTYNQWLQSVDTCVFVSATPGKIEDSLEQSRSHLITRPTGILDPEITVKPIENQIDNLIEEINSNISNGEKTLVITLTKKQSEDLTDFLNEVSIRTAYIHSDVKTPDRTKIIHQLMEGELDVIVGINLLREGLDIPEVSLVCILDADKEGFLRNYTSMTQSAGRAARNINGRVIMYADKMTKSMERTILENNKRREVQEKANSEKGILPSSLRPKDSERQTIFERKKKKADTEIESLDLKPKKGQSKNEFLDYIWDQMQKAAKKKDFVLAARLRDHYFSEKKTSTEISNGTK